MLITFADATLDYYRDSQKAGAQGKGFHFPLPLERESGGEALANLLLLPSE